MIEDCVDNCACKVDSFDFRAAILLAILDKLAAMVLEVFVKDLIWYPAT